MKKLLLGITIGIIISAILVWVFRYNLVAYLIYLMFNS